MDLPLLCDQEGFRQQVIELLAQAPVDFLEPFGFIEKQKGGPDPWEGAGILLPLYFNGEKDPGLKQEGQYVFLLNKRSSQVPQAGDLCAPGGGIHPFWDALFQKLLQTGFFPGARGPAFERARLRGKAAYARILFFLSNALRESWEEIHLSPFNVEFLGPLSPYRLQSRRWIIFPLIGRVRQAWEPKLSREVEKVVSIPLRAFFLPENYGVYSLEVPEKLAAQGIPSPWEFPCLVYNADGEEEILWGATFTVIRTFLRTVLNFPLPSPDGRRVIRRPLIDNYFSGSRRSSEIQ